MSRVGIIVRTKDRPTMLRRALLDIGAQTFTDWQVRVVNDGGDPAAVENAVEQALPGDARVQVLHHETSRGRWPAAAAGLAALGTELVNIHDDDDTWHPEFLARCVAHLDAHQEEGGVVVRTEIIHEELVNGQPREVGREPFWAQLHAASLVDLLKINTFVPISLLYRRAVHDEVGGFDETLQVIGDYEFHLRLLIRYEVGFIEGQPLAFWHHRAEAKGADSNSMYADSAKHWQADRKLRDSLLREFIEKEGLAQVWAMGALHHETIETIHQAINRIEALHARIDALEARLSGAADAQIGTRALRGARESLRGLTGRGPGRQ